MKPSITVKKSFSPRQVAQAVGVSESSVKRWCDDGLLSLHRTAGGHRRVPLHAVMSLVRERGMALSNPAALGLPAMVVVDATARLRGGGNGAGGVVLADSGAAAGGGVEAAPPRAAALSEAVRSPDVATDQLCRALEAGDEQAVFSLLTRCYAEGYSIATIADEMISGAFRLIGEHWSHNALSVYQERRACEVLRAALHAMRPMLRPLAAGSPLALGATLSPDRYANALALAELALRSVGWRAVSLGTGHPPESLVSAIVDERPELLWLSVSYFSDEAAFVAAFERVSQAAEAQGTALVVGGQALRAELRRRLSYSAYGDTIQHLVSFAQSLRKSRV